MGEMFKDIFSGGAFEGVYELLNVALLGGEKYEAASDLVTDAYHGIMVPIALALLVIFFVCTLVEKSTNEQFTYEQLFLLFAKLVVGVYLIDMGLTLMIEFQQFGLSFLKEFKVFTEEAGLNGGGINIDDSEPLKELYFRCTGATWPEDPGFFDAVKRIFNGGTFTLLLAWLFTFIVKCVVYLVVFMRILEIYIRTLFAPIALSDVFYQGLNSTGFRFLKSYLAVSLQLVMIFGCVVLYGVLASDLATEASAKTVFLLKYMGLTGATVGVLLKSQSLIKELLGAN